MGMIIIAGLVVFGAVMGLKLVPAYVEYATIKSTLREIARAPDTRDAVDRDIREAFDRRAQIDDISSVKGTELLIVREGGGVTLSAQWDRQIHMVGNISALLEFDASSDH